MKAFNVTYKDGRFFEVGTDRPLALLPDTEALLIVEKEQDVKLSAKLSENLNSISSTEKLAQVQRDSFKFKKIFSAGDILFFYMPISKVKRLAQAELLEDLYLYNGIHTNSSDLALYNCICQCNKIEGLEMKKPIVSPSISDLFKRIYIHYNGNQGNAARNAFKIFFTNRSNPNSTLDDVRNQVTL